MQYIFLCENFRLSLGSMKSKKYACDLLNKEKKRSKYHRAFLVLSCDTVTFPPSFPLLILILGSLGSPIFFSPTPMFYSFFRQCGGWSQARLYIYIWCFHWPIFILMFLIHVFLYAGVNCS